MEGVVQYLLQSFQKAYPDLQGMIAPKESVKQVLEVIDNLSTEQTGLMISHHGNQEWV
jgi:hypothetical protein